MEREETRQRVSLAEARQARAGHPAAAEAYQAARLRFELAEAIRARREELGWSQRQLAERAGMTQPGVAQFEAGGTTPRERRAQGQVPCLLTGSAHRRASARAVIPVHARPALKAAKQGAARRG